VNLPGSNWGATADERAVGRPCDELIAEPRFVCNRAISIEAPTSVVFRRLCQLRVAPYSYDLLDNLGRRSPRELTPGMDELEVGQRFMKIFALASFEPDVHVTLRGETTTVTYAVDPFEAGTRLTVRILLDPRTSLRTAVAPVLIAGDLVMMRKQLLTLKDLAEQDADAVSSTPAGGNPDAGPGPLHPSA
jgi:hypothetical protein